MHAPYSQRRRGSVLPGLAQYSTEEVAGYSQRTSPCCWPSWRGLPGWYMWQCCSSRGVWGYACLSTLKSSAWISESVCDVHGVGHGWQWSHDNESGRVLFLCKECGDNGMLRSQVYGCEAFPASIPALLSCPSNRNEHQDVPLLYIRYRTRSVAIVSW